MRRFRNWIINKFLPTWAREELLGEIAKLQKENDRLRAEVDRLNAYIDGLENGIRVQRRIIINTGKEGEP